MSTEEVRPYRQALITAGLRESQTLVRELEGDPRAEHQRVDAYILLEQVQFEEGEGVAALESVRKAVALAESLVARDPSSIRCRASLAGALHQLAATLPDDESRRSAARRSTEIYLALAAEHPEGDRLSWLRTIAMNHYNTGNDAGENRRYPEAIEAFLAARTACEKAIELGDHTPRTPDLAARNLMNLCRAFQGVKRSGDAIAAGQGALAIFQTLVHDHPDDFGYAYQLRLAYEELGLKDLILEKWDQAIDRFQNSRKILQGMAATQGALVSRMATIQGSLAVTDYNLREAYDSDPARYAEPRRAITREAYEICDKLSLVQPLSWNLRIVYAQQCFEMADYQEEEGGEPEVDLILKSEQLWAELIAKRPLSPTRRFGWSSSGESSPIFWKLGAEATRRRTGAAKR